MDLSSQPLAHAAARAVRREGAWALAVLLLASLPDFTTMVPGANVTLGSLTIHPLDALAAAAIVLAGIRLARGARVGAASVALLLLWVLLLVGTAAGVASFGLQTAVNDGRTMIYALAALTYAASLPRDWARCDLLGLVPATAVLVVCCVLRIAQDGILLRAGADQDTSVFELRPVTAPGALLMLVTAVLLLTSARRVTRWQWAGAAALLVLLVIVQQRTVWFCIPVCLAVWLVGAWWSHRDSGPGDSPRVSGRALAAVAVVMGAAVLAILSVPALRRSASDGSTFDWRVHQWQDGLVTLATPLQWLIGVPRGTLRRFWGATSATGQEYYKPPTDLTTHSLYVDTLLHVGLIGLAALVLLLVLAASPRRLHPWVTSAGMLALVAAFVVYGVTYFLPTFAFLIVGMGLWGTLRTQVKQ